MKQFIAICISVILLSACSSMNVRPTVGVSMGTTIHP